MIHVTPLYQPLRIQHSATHEQHHHHYNHNAADNQPQIVVDLLIVRFVEVSSHFRLRFVPFFVMVDYFLYRRHTLAGIVNRVHIREFLVHERDNPIRVLSVRVRPKAVAFFVRINISDLPYYNQQYAPSRQYHGEGLRYSNNSLHDGLTDLCRRR